ncbi:sensor histidine kinase [Blastococcus sp. SYSU DS0541]
MRTPRHSVVSGAAAVAVGGAATSAVLTAAQVGEFPAGAWVVALVIVVYAGVGVLICLARPGHRVGLVLLGGAAVWGLGEAILAVGVQGLVTTPMTGSAAALLAVAGTVLRGLGWLVLVLLVPLVFPDGRLPGRPWRWAIAASATALFLFTATSVLAPAPMDERLAAIDSPVGLSAGLGGVVDGLAVLALGAVAAAVAGAVGSLVSRWRGGGPLLRQQLLWLTWAAAVPAAVLPLILVGAAETLVFGVAVLPLPVAIGVAVLQHRLYDVQPAVSRTIASVGLSAALAAVYVLAVAGVGALLDARRERWLPWLATGLVALSFSPLRQALQRAANRLTYGQWAQPEEVLAAVRRRVADATDVDGLLQDLVRELAEVLELPAIVVLDGAGRPLAVHGAADLADRETTLTGYGRAVGVLRWTMPPRPLRDRDLRLLDDISGQLGALVHASSLLTGLRAAHERLILAREDERRRLRRDLHDGLGSALAGLTLKADAARNLLDDPTAADAALLDLRAGIQNTVQDVRRVVEGLRPPSLDELGLVGAVRELAERLQAELPDGTDVDADDELPALPAAAEVACYRVIQEALTNAVRHSGASTCRVTLRTDGEELCAEIADDGSGMVRPRAGGSGLPGMRERASDLGGSLAIDARPGRGTTVRLRLPIPRAQAAAPRSDGALL